MSFSGPMHLSPRPYRGQNSRKQTESNANIAAAQKIEDYINTRYVANCPKTFSYSEISRELCIDHETVRRLLCAKGGGPHEITV